MDKDQEIIKLKEEIQQLKYALITVFTECSSDTPAYLKGRIGVMKRRHMSKT